MDNHIQLREWESCLAEFCRRNRARTTRLVVVDGLSREEQEHGLPLNGICVERDSSGTASVEIMFGGVSTADPRHLVRIIPHVRRVTNHLAANCCDTLEIEDESGMTTVLDFGSLTNLGESSPARFIRGRPELLGEFARRARAP